jgi:hypothetical protein
MVLDILQIVLPPIVLVIGIISLIGRIKEHNRLLILKELTIIFLALTILSLTIRALW